VLGGDFIVIQTPVTQDQVDIRFYERK